MGLLQQQQQPYYSGNNFGNYQFTSLNNIISQFKIAYVGEDKIISKAKITDISFHAQRALQELSFDTLKSIKAQEITVPATLQMILPQDYVNYTKLSSVDSAGIKHVLYPTSKTSNPPNALQSSTGDFELAAVGTFTPGDDTVKLDKIYPNIKAGMVVESSHVPNNRSVINSFFTDATATYINLGDFAHTTAFALSTVNSFAYIGGAVSVDFSIKIRNADNSLVQSANSSYAANDVPFTGDRNFLTLTAADVANVEVGMEVNGRNLVEIPSNTIITAINGNNITLSNTTVVTGLTTIDINFISPISDSDTWKNYKSNAPSENNDDYEDSTYWPMSGNRYGLDPQHAQANGSFYIDEISGKIHFSSNISGKTVILDYISDSLGTDDEMQVHKFAEEAMYKSIAYAILSTRANTQEYMVQRYKKEKFAAIRTAKLRLSNVKLEELTQTLRGKSKQIKH